MRQEQFMKHGQPKKVQRVGTRPISRSKQREISNVVKAVNSGKLVMLMALRNQGWGYTRLKRISEQFDEILRDSTNGLLSFEDMMVALEEETGLKKEDYVI